MSVNISLSSEYQNTSTSSRYRMRYITSDKNKSHLHSNIDFNIGTTTYLNLEKD